MNAYLDAYRPTLAVLCRKHNVKHLYLFGSVLTSRFNENSDVDLVERAPISNPVFKRHVEQTKQKIYG